MLIRSSYGTSSLLLATEIYLQIRKSYERHTFLGKASHFRIKFSPCGLFMPWIASHEKSYDTKELFIRSKGTKTSNVFIASKNQENSKERERERESVKRTNFRLEYRSAYFLLLTHAYTNKLFLVSFPMCCVK